jgi:probable F420-dependent oxidoreductase
VTLTVRVGVGLSPLDSSDADRLWSVIDALEEQGWDSIWLSDSATLGGLAPLPALAAIGARTRKLKLGTGVLVLPPRNPVMLAKELATVDALSGGRLLPAAGLGIDLATEREALGVPRGERTARLEEAIAIVKLLWAAEPVSYEGRFWSLSDVELEPRPRKRKLEMWLGGRADAALRRAGRIADGWLASFVSPDEFGPMVETIRAAAAEAGRSIDEDHYGMTLFAVPSEDELPPEALRRLARRPDLRDEDHVAIGAPALRELLERFRAEGATKFVVIPIARDLVGWLAELRDQAAPFEAAATSNGGGSP